VLHVAATHANTKIVKLLLDKVEEKQIKSADGWGNTPLHYAKNADIAKLLIDAGANIEQENIQGYFRGVGIADL
jgi:ankyrin repeat protein